MTHSEPIPDDSRSPVSPEEQPTPSPANLEAEAEIPAPAPVLSELLEPPEEPLTAPRIKQSEEKGSETESIAQIPESPWLVVAKNRRVNRDWEALMLRAPENTRRCYQDLCTAPIARKPKRVFPLKGKLYKGAWEYEVTGSDRVFYVPDEDKRKVLVYYAGTHPKSTPFPP
ncbi:hypothetical protein QT972_01975 [Microcoleus sp. herbarium7]|uniref:hypothetical protein n=1 Tax=Microcoleus sp. herbarium7 TaxID=3055435 RepID=UPI002FD129C1